MLTPLYPLSGTSVLLEDAWHLPEPRASQGDLDQPGVGCIPTLCTMLPHSIQEVYRALASSRLFGIIIWNSLVIVYYIWEMVTLLDFFNFPSYFLPVQ